MMLFIPTSWEPNRNDFLKALGISLGGLGEHFFGKVFDALFIDSIDIKHEFNKYYSIEYNNLAEYVEIRYGKSLSDEELDNDRVYMAAWLPQVIDPMYEDNKLNTILDCIKILEEQNNENQN